MRPRYVTKSIRLVGPLQKQAAIALIQNAPEDAEKPLEVLIREEKKTRGLDHNAAMWSGPLRDIADQAWVGGRKFSAETWHEHFKRKYLPEDDDPELDSLARDNYRKWDYTPDGDRVMVGSTTNLTSKGMARYLLQVEAEGAELGVRFHANPNRRAA